MKSISTELITWYNKHLIKSYFFDSIKKNVEYRLKIRAKQHAETCQTILNEHNISWTCNEISEKSNLRIWCEWEIKLLKDEGLI